jgi:hypothetical protein
VLNHLAVLSDPIKRMRNWLSVWASWMPDREANQLLGRVLIRPIRWRADKLGALLNLTDAERTQARVTTIGSVDVSKEERAKRRRERKRLRKERKRRAKGALPRERYLANSLSRQSPWEAAGMSRATWYRQRKMGATPAYGRGSVSTHATASVVTL